MKTSQNHSKAKALSPHEQSPMNRDQGESVTDPYLKLLSAVLECPMTTLVKHLRGKSSARALRTGTST